MLTGTTEQKDDSMHTTTGEIRKFVSVVAAKDAGFTVPLSEEEAAPDPSGKNRATRRKEARDLKKIQAKLARLLADTRGLK
jgi:hypothetical protein